MLRRDGKRLKKTERQGESYMRKMTGKSTRSAEKDSILRNGDGFVSRDTERKPVSAMKTYLKYGFVITEYETHLCPACGHVLNAGPNYQPRYCDQCGQRINFEGIEWKQERELGFL